MLRTLRFKRLLNTSSHFHFHSFSTATTFSHSPSNYVKPTNVNKYIREDIEITSEMVKFYTENGFLIVDDILTDSQIELWRKSCDNAVYARDDTWGFPEKGQQDINSIDFEFYKNVFIQRINLFKTDEKMNELVLNAGYIIGKIAYTLEQYKNKKIDSIRLYHDQALYKESYGNSTSWHFDNAFWAFNSFNSISCWVALDNVDYINGCMVYLAKSHNVIKNKEDKNEIFKEIIINYNMNNFFNFHPELKGLEAVPAKMKAGSCGFHNGLLAHGASCNFTNNIRRAMTFQMFPNNSVFNGRQNILTDEQFKKKKIGDLLTIDSDNPILYKEY